MSLNPTGLMKSSARVAAGRRNRQLRGPLTDSGRMRLQEAALRHQPWRFSTGPRTEGGKAVVAANGRKRQIGGISARQAHAAAADVQNLIAAIAGFQLPLGL